MIRSIESLLSLRACIIVMLSFFIDSGLMITAESKEPMQDQTTPSSTSNGASELSTQEAQPADPKPVNQEPATATVAAEKRLDAIEKLLGELATEIKSAGVATPVPATAPAPASPAAGPAATPTAQPSNTQERRAARPDPNLIPPPSVKLDGSWLENIKWRSIGPANMSGRITDIAVHEKDSSLWWIATASGGLLKSINHGGSLQHQFDREKVVSIGSIATDPNNKDVLWVGTGEINPRNSVSYGNGVYKTVDGGKTFQHLGLDRSYQIARILVDPKDSDTVYVGAAGRLYGKNSERGVYKTTDGGKSWQQILFVDDQTGVIDMVMNPKDSNNIVVAMWDRVRDGFDSWPGTEPKPDGVDGYDPIRKWGPGGGLYRTTDAGKSWTKLSSGLPNMTGRIGLDWQLGSPNVLYAIIDCEDIGKGPKPFPAFLGIVGENTDGKPLVMQLLPNSPAEKAGVKVGDQLLAIDGENISEFDQLLDALRGKKVGSKIGLKFKRGTEEKTYEIMLTGRPGTSQQNVTIFLGVTGEEKEGKVTIQRVVEGASASKAGLKVGDVIAKVAGKEPTSFRSMMDELQKKADGDKVQFEVVRGEEKLELSVTLEARVASGQPTPAQSNVFIGIQGEDSSAGGATLTTITEAGPAEKAGLKAGDIVKQFDGKDVASYEALITAIRARKPEDKVKVKVQRGEESVEVEVVLADRLSGGSNTRPYTYSYFGQLPNIQDQQGADGYKYGGVYRSTDSGVTWQRVNSLNTRPMYFSVVKVDPSDEKNVHVLGVSQSKSSNGGTTFTDDFGRRVHADAHDLWINPSDGRHMIIGCDGGIYVTYDTGATWDHINTVAIGQFYHVAISPRQPYWVAGGLQDNGSWAGPAISRNSGAVNEDWISLNGGDGFVCRVDPNDPDLFYAESQNGAIVRRHLKTGDRASIRPPRVEGVSYRFNWNTPFILSNHNSKIFYSAGNYVFRSLDRGNDLRVISPEITLTKRGSATALAESPSDPNVLYAGTDDGALWVTRNGGYEWKNITQNLGLPNPRWVATIEASRHAPGRVYACLDGHRSDDDNPYAFVSEDFGATFKPLHTGLPWGSTRCLREDLINPNLLYLGTEFGFWVSIDRGQNWAQMNQSLPTVAVHEVAIHPENGEIVVATHGRSLWACDVSGLRQLKAENIGKETAFFEPVDVIRWRSEPSRGGTNRSFVGQNPSNGAKLWYALPKKAERVVVRIENIQGELVSELTAQTDPGMHLVTWNLTQSAARSRGASPTSVGPTDMLRRFDRNANNMIDPDEMQGPAEFLLQRLAQNNPKIDLSKPISIDTLTSELEKMRAGQSERSPQGLPGSRGGSPAPSGASPTSVGPTEMLRRFDRNGNNMIDPGELPEFLLQRLAQDNPKFDLSKPISIDTLASELEKMRAGQSERSPQALPTSRGGSPVPNGTYKVQLLVGGKEIKSYSITVNRDPNLPENAVADELFELELLLEKQAQEDTFQNKSNGRGNYSDD